ncbi:MAG TPA: helix-turn-helix transcriptional regulator [Bryobacteraceae bacterium]|nr:helix-turn-helix transcriptional regulator [Bryobacteraceae bacterium]
MRQDLRQPEFSEGYAESFQDAYVATQIKVLREQNKWTQADLAKEIGTTQTAISRIENVNYSAWNISTLKKLARAFRVRLKVSFETYGSLIYDVDTFSRDALQRVPREADPELMESAAMDLFWTPSGIIIVNEHGGVITLTGPSERITKQKLPRKGEVIVMPTRTQGMKVRPYVRREKRTAA